MAMEDVMRGEIGEGRKEGRMRRKQRERYTMLAMATEQAAVYITFSATVQFASSMNSSTIELVSRIS